jgi:putative oligomerization/nucleic acid binding protein
MQQLTPEGRQIVDGVAYRHGFSSGAVAEMLGAVAVGHGNQAQFNHYEFGGMGQWSSGGMVMIGDMFNNGLKARVSSLCQELAGLIQGQPLFVMPNSSQSQSQGGGWQGQMGGYGQQQSSSGVSGTSLFVGGGYNNWWPTDLGAAGSTGAQNNLRYAYFPAIRRLAIDVNGQVSVYETGDHQIGGFSQQQSGDQSLTFTSQFGLVRVLDLPLVSGPGQMGQQASIQTPPMQPVQPAPQAAPMASPAPAAPQSNYVEQGSSASQTGNAASLTSDEIFAAIEKLAALHAKGILTDGEFGAKKSELLQRL